MELQGRACRVHAQPSYGIWLRGILTYDDGESSPLTPYDYVSLRLAERLTALEKQDAVDVTATAVADDSNMFGEAPSAAPKDGVEFLRSLTSAPLQPVIIAGLPGSGKGVMAAIALSLGVKERGLRYWIFNPKNKLEEAGYWVRAERHYLKDRLMTDESLFADLMKVLEEFSSEGSRRNNQPGNHEPFVLLLEEITCQIGLFTPKQKQIFKSKLTAVASLLRGANMAIWLSGQSVTLEDLGFSGRSNRAMFTAIAAVGSDRTGSSTVCDLIAIPFDEATLPPGRCWLTSNAVYSAVQAPGTIPQYPDWGMVPNVIDLRPGALAASEVEEVTLDNLFEPIAPPTISENLVQPIPQSTVLSKQQLEEAYKLNYAEPTKITEVKATDDPTALLRSPLDEIARYLIGKDGEVEMSCLKNWGKNRRKGALNSGEIEDHLLEMMEQNLIETFTPQGKKGEFVRWIASR